MMLREGVYGYVGRARAFHLGRGEGELEGAAQEVGLLHGAIGVERSLSVCGEADGTGSEIGAVFGALKGDETEPLETKDMRPRSGGSTQSELRRQLVKGGGNLKGVEMVGDGEEGAPIARGRVVRR